MHPSWKQALAGEFRKDYFVQIAKFLDAERAAGPVFPKNGEVFTAFGVTPFDAVKVVILGQDPYHDDEQAHGLSFSVKPTTPVPPSLRNIYKELESDLGIPRAKHGHLIKWAEQGVFLLNTVLTVRAHQPGSHQGHGWETFTDRVISVLNDRETPVIFVLWGQPAREKKALITEARHSILESAHPSPFSADRGFFGSKPFSKVNEILIARGAEPINWDLR